MRIDSGDGADDITIEGLRGPNPLAGERVDIRTGAGNDYVFLRYDDLEMASINTGDGDNYIEVYDTGAERLDIRTGSGADEIDVGSTSGSTRIGRLNVNSGAGDDEVCLSDSMFSEVDVNTSGGSDEVFVENVEVDSELEMRTGSGVDVVRLQDCNISYDVRLGSGDDEVFLENMSLIGRTGSINGNNGLDTLTPINSSIPELRSIEGN